MRKSNIEHQLARRPDGITGRFSSAVRSAPIYSSAACRMDLERLVFKASRLALPWRPAEVLDQDEERKPSSDRARYGLSRRHDSG